MTETKNALVGINNRLAMEKEKGSESKAWQEKIHKGKPRKKKGKKKTESVCCETASRSLLSM